MGYDIDIDYAKATNGLPASAIVTSNLLIALANSNQENTYNRQLGLTVDSPLEQGIDIALQSASGLPGMAGKFAEWGSAVYDEQKNAQSVFTASQYSGNLRVMLNGTDKELLREFENPDGWTIVRDGVLVKPQNLAGMPAGVKLMQVNLANLSNNSIEPKGGLLKTINFKRFQNEMQEPVITADGTGYKLKPIAIMIYEDENGNLFSVNDRGLVELCRSRYPDTVFNASVIRAADGFSRDDAVVLGIVNDLTATHKTSEGIYHAIKKNGIDINNLHITDNEHLQEARDIMRLEQGLQKLAYKDGPIKTEYFALVGNKLEDYGRQQQAVRFLEDYHAGIRTKRSEAEKIVAAVGYGYGDDEQAPLNETVRILEAVCNKLNRQTVQNIGSGGMHRKQAVDAFWRGVLDPAGEHHALYAQLRQLAATATDENRDEKVEAFYNAAMVELGNARLERVSFM